MQLSSFELLVFLTLTTTLVAVTGAMALLAVNRHTAFVAMRKLERDFRALYDNIDEGVFRSSLDGRMLSANPALARLNGYVSETEMLDDVNDIGGRWYVDPDRRAEIHNMLLRDGQVSRLLSEVYRYKSRDRIWIEESTRLVRDERTGAPRYYEGTVREVTEFVRQAEIQRRFEKISSIIQGCLYQYRLTTDGKASAPYVSEGIKGLMGVTPEAFMEDAGIIEILAHPADRGRVTQSFLDSAKTLTPRELEYRIITPEGVEKWIYGHSVPESEADGSVAWYGFATDITERKRAEARVFDLAYLDALTGLPNRAALRDGLQSAIAIAEKESRWSALLFIDLDQFKVLNDTKGHHFGDILLRGVAARLRPIVDDDDVVARLGGDEFVVLVRDLGSNGRAAEGKIKRLAERIQGAIASPFALEGFPFHTSASIGVTLFCGKQVSVDELLRRADMAMYEAKASGRGAIAFFAIEMQEQLEEDLELTTELRGALEQGGLTLAYQPQVDETGACTGVEALLRWDHPVRGSIPPSVFIPLAERAGLGASVDAFVLAEACAVLHAWDDVPELSQMQMAVNIGHQQLGAGLVALVTDAVRATRADPTRLTIELTERVMLDRLDEVDSALAALKKLGVRIALDDFGTGYSSLAHLKRLPIDLLKIDRSFVADIETDPNDRVIVQTILNIARNLGISAIAEGVETEMQALLLRRFGCHAFQGFMYGRPMTRAEFEAGIAAGDTPRDETLPPRRRVV